ncbi:DUF2793 domain-containing protein [Xanthobacter autotrophicus]|uniref:DUF2793 domain-containing protein n=1 Tax=Xanthobacter autotrophicus TaxID=280 RepID=UPI00372A31D3
MTFSAYYGVGTVTVAAGGTAVTGSGTLWSALLQPGDTFEAAGRAVRILDVVDDTHLTLAYGWPGSALAASAYLVVYNAPARSSGTYVAERARELIERQRILDDGIPTYAAKAAGTVTPPATPVASDLYLIGSAPTGVWAGYAGYLAVATDAGGWRFTAPEQGMRVYDTTADAVWERHSAGWVNIAPVSASLLGAANGVATLDSGGKVPTAQLPVGMANGVATLDSGGKIPTAQLPALAITDVFTVATQAAMLALTAQIGDLAIRTDLNKTFVLAASPATTLANWAEVLAPTAAVSSVAGRTGAVVLVKGDVGLGSVDNTSDAGKPVSTAQAAAIASAVAAGVTGNVVQVVNASTTAVATTTALIPYDDTIPQITEGAEVLTATITPKSATNVLRIDVSLQLSPSVQSSVIVALFKGSGADALAAGIDLAGAGSNTQVVISCFMVAGSTSAQTFRVRMGMVSAGTLTLNGLSAARRFGGVSASTISIVEING